MSDGRPPYRSAPPLPVPSVPAVPTGRKVGLVALAVVLTVLLVAVGFFIGLLWTFAACWKQTCSDVDAAAIVLMPVAGLAIGIGCSALLRRFRAWFYAHPVAIWAPLAVATLFLLQAVIQV